MCYSYLTGRRCWGTLNPEDRSSLVHVSVRRRLEYVQVSSGWVTKPTGTTNIATYRSGDPPVTALAFGTRSSQLSITCSGFHLAADSVPESVAESEGVATHGSHIHPHFPTTLIPGR